MTIHEIDDRLRNLVRLAKSESFRPGPFYPDDATSAVMDLLLVVAPTILQREEAQCE